MRIADYTRISTDEEHQPYSLEAQTHRLAAYVESQDGWELVRSFSDQKSGATLDRPGLQRALREARAGRFDLLLVYRVDRLARSVRGLAHILEELDAAGVAFRSATEPFDTTTAAGRMMVQLLGVFAEFERATIIDRTIAGMERKAARGEWCGGSRPFGYEVDADAGVLVVHDGEAALVAVIFDLYVNERRGARAIANWLNEQGYRTRTGKPWSHMSVLTVLRNRAYLGEILFRNTYHAAAHPPLVDEAVFDQAAKLLAERRGNPRRRAANASDYLLAGLVVCEDCGKHYVGTAATGKQRRYRYYTCFTRQRYGKNECSAERLPADELDDAILAALLDTYEESDLFDQATASAQGSSDELRHRTRQELAAAQAEIHKTEDALERYLMAFEAGTMSEAHCAPRVEKLAGKLTDLRNRRQELAHAVEGGEVPVPTAAELAQVRNLLRRAIKNGPTNVRKALVQELVHEVRVRGRDAIYPTFYVSPPPGGSATGVRKLARSAPPAGLEPATSSLEVTCSVQLSYGGRGGSVALSRLSYGRPSDAERGRV